MYFLACLVLSNSKLFEYVITDNYMDKIKLFLGALLLLLLSLQVNAALISRLDGLAYYDSEADLTWLADANAGGLMNWPDSNAWAANLTVGGVFGWRLASLDNCIDYYCTTSEIGNFFFNVLGGIGEQQLTLTHNANFDLFSNIQAGDYWSTTDLTGDNRNAWIFNMGNGIRSSANKGRNTYFAWAIRDGDVAAVPEPSILALMLSGILGLGALRRRKQIQSA